MMNDSEKLEKALDLLERAAACFETSAPDIAWFREYFVLTGEHMILTEEGWEPGSVKQDYLNDWAKNPEWSNPILDEVNA